MKNLTIEQKIRKIINEQVSNMNNSQLQAYTDNYDGFSHYSLNGLEEEVIDICYNEFEGEEMSIKDIENIVFDLI